jgi:ligand-binding sensor domain-containing protein
MKYWKIFAVIAISALEVSAQSFPVGSWKNFTSMKEVQSVLATDRALYAASSGGMFVYDFATKKLKQYNNSDGLASNSLQSLGTDTDGNIWIGATTGAISVFNPQTESWKSILEIQNIDPTRWTQRAIRGFVQNGTMLYVIADFGVAEFRLSKWEFGDTYTNFGFTSSPQVTSFLVQGDQLWVGTTAGVATASRLSSNLSSPDAWSQRLLNGLSSSSVTSMILFHDTLLVSTPSGVVAYLDDAFSALPQLSSISVKQMCVVNDTLFLLHTNGNSFTISMMQYVTDTPLPIVSSNGSASSVAHGTAFYVGTSTTGVLKFESGSVDTLLPNGPASNIFTSLAVDENGVLWAASRPAYGAGFYRYNPDLSDDSQWKNFSSDRYPIMQKNNQPFDDYYWVSIGANNSVWISSWGNGVVELRGDSIYRKLDYYSKPSLPGAVNQNPPAYVVTGAVAVDNNGKTWITNRVGYSGRSLVRLDTDTSATYFDNELSPSEALFHGLWIDQYNTKWMANSVPSDMKQPGLFYLNEQKLISGTTSGGWGKLSTSNGLPSNTVLYVVGDLDGNVWIGTNSGVRILFDPLSPTSLSSSYILNGRVIQSIAVDGMNNKWVGTKEGVLVVNPDGSELLAQYSTTTTNGLLPTNDVRSVAIDSKRGVAYFGTEAGLSALGIAAIHPQKEYTSLQCSPQPFIVPNESQLVIRNLVTNSVIKILTVSGKLVKQFSAQGGGRAFWDGTDSNGKLVASGIYIVIAYASDENKTVSGKIAVIRR